MSLPHIQLPWELREDDEIISEITSAWAETLQERGVERHRVDVSHGQMVIGFFHRGQTSSVNVWFPSYGFSKANKQKVVKDFKHKCHELLIEKIKKHEEKVQ